MPKAVARLQTLQRDGNRIVLITGRQEARRNDTQVALRNAGVPYEQLLMNTFGPERSQQLMSKEHNMITVMREGPIEEAADNDYAVRNLYKAMGITVVPRW